jgi:hypothetical protein
MKKLWMYAALAGAAGCNNVEIGLVPLHVPTPALMEAADGTVSCTFDAQAPAIADLRMDLNRQRVLSLQVLTQNNLRNEPLILEMEPPQQFIPNPNSVTPLRFDYRWECDASGFGGDLGPLVLPAFSSDVSRPFCVDQRDAATGDFVGFDVVTASGPALRPTSEGLISVRPVTAQLGDAFADFFEISGRAEQCCRDAGGCENLPSMAAAQASCTALQNIFDRFAGRGVLDVRKAEDVQRFRPYATFTASLTPQGRAIPAYYLRLRGTFEGVNANGSLVTSSEFLSDIGLCSGNSGAGCGYRNVELCMQ